MKNKIFTKALLAILVAVACRGMAQGVIPWSSPIVNPDDGYTYILLTKGNWTDSEAEAIVLGGHLATISNQAQQDWVFNTFGGYNGNPHLLWIGLNDVSSPLTFVWADGSPVTYTHWATGEPNNTGGVERYGAMYYPGHSQEAYWNDWSDRTADPIGLPFNGVVQIVPEPSVLALVLFGLFGITLAAKRRTKPVA